MASDGHPTDARLALILRRIGAGGTITAAGLDAGVTRKTIGRWRSPGQWCVPGFGDACDRVASLASARTPEAIVEIQQIIEAWATPRPRVADDVFEEPFVAEADVLDAVGRELVTSRGRPESSRHPAPRSTPEQLTAEQLYPRRRAPTRDEWVSMMADLALDPMQPASVRCAAIASGNAALVGQQLRRGAAEQAADAGAAEAASSRGRDPGVPATVWKEARANFLGPVPAEAEQGGDVVGFERAPDDARQG